MTDKEDRNIIPSQGGVFNDLTLRVKLILRLMGDSRVSPLLKLTLSAASFSVQA